MVRVGSKAPGDLDPTPGSKNLESSDCRKSQAHSGATLPPSAHRSLLRHKHCSEGETDNTA